MLLSVKHYNGSADPDDHSDFLKCLLNQTCFCRIQEKENLALNHVAKKSEMLEFWYFQGHSKIVEICIYCPHQIK